MNAVISATARTGRRVRRSLRRFIKRLTRKAVIELTVTVSLPPFLKNVVGYEAKPKSPPMTTGPAEDLGSRGALQCAAGHADGPFCPCGLRSISTARQPGGQQRGRGSQLPRRAIRGE